MIELDGNYGEGGGSLVRVALALSAFTGQEFMVEKIRSGRKDAGLKAQHVQAIEALKQLCGAQTNPVEMGTLNLQFKPGKVQKGTYHIDIGTAGSISLLLQALILPAMFASGKVTFIIRGGTCGKWQASVDYIQNILFPYLQRLVEKIELKVLKRGYYPKGGGEARVEISPKFKLINYNSWEHLLEDLRLRTPKIILINQGTLEQVRGIVNVSWSLQEKEVGERIKKAAENGLRKYNVPITIRVEYSNTRSVGGEIVLWAIFSQDGKMDYDNPIILGSDALVEEHKSYEQVGQEAAERLRGEIDAGSVVDPHLADQLIPFLGLLVGSTIVTPKISNHALTNIYVVEKFLPVGFKVEGGKISVEEKN